MFVLYIIVYAQSKSIFGPKVVHLSPSLQREPRNQPYIRLIQLKSIKYITYIFEIALGRKLAFFGRSETPGRPYVRKNSDIMPKSRSDISIPTESRPPGE